MDNNTIVQGASKEWTAERANDILKAAHELQTLCDTTYGCIGCPLRTSNGVCVFTRKPAVPWKWHIQEKTVYTVKLPDA